MLKIKIPVKKNRYVTNQRMMGNSMMRNKIINRNKLIIDENQLKYIIEELIEDNVNIIEIHRNKPIDWSLILSINLSENTKEYNVRKIMSVISEKYDQYQFSNVWIL